MGPEIQLKNTNNNKQLKSRSYVTFLPCRIQFNELNTTEIQRRNRLVSSHDPTEMRHRFNYRIADTNKSLYISNAVHCKTRTWNDQVMRSLRNANNDGQVFAFQVWNRTLSLHIWPEHVFRVTGVLNSSKEKILLVKYKFIFDLATP